MINHLIADAWTVSLIAEYTTKYIYGDNTQIPKSPAYIEFVTEEKKYLSSQKYTRDQEFWRSVYTSVPQESSIKLRTSGGKDIESYRYTWHLSKEETARIDCYESYTGISPAVLFESAVVIYLALLNPENEMITLGMPVLNRLSRAERNTFGMFISTMPLTISVGSDKKVEEICRSIKHMHFNIFRHMRYPISHILRDIRDFYKFEGNLYDVLVSFQNAQIHEKVTTKWYSNGYCEVPLEIHIDKRDYDGHYVVNMDYWISLFSEKEIKLLSKRLLFIIQQIINQTNIMIKDVKIMPEEELEEILSFNESIVPISNRGCVHELFEEKVRYSSDKTALVFNTEEFSYGQLDRMSNSLAHFLRTKGVGRNDIIPIISRRSWHVIVAMLGILKAGAAYMPVDPTFPAERMADMFEIAEARIVITYDYDESLPLSRIELEHFDFSYNETSIENINDPEDTCYVIFTSGSTGKPKGIAASHSNVFNYTNNNKSNAVCHRIVHAGYGSIVSVTNVIFDIFVTESLLPLLNGMTIYFADDETVFSQKKLATLISSQQIDVIQTTPTKMRSYIMDKQNVTYLRNLKAIVLGGEAFPVDLYEELRKYTEAEIFNIYGPAETTVWSTNKEVTSRDITIGYPIANTQVYIVDSNLNILPAGVAGELCIAGAGVGKGYVNRPDLTAEKFVPNPFASEENEHGKIMYRTGDLARWRADGEIEYLGRIDTQVKIRGLRIELAEIESVMSSFRGINLAAVTDKKDENCRQYLVGYYTADTEVDEREIRGYLSSKLPKYMVPNYFVHLEKMPMTASGKTDRKNLPLPVFMASSRDYIEPETEDEKKLAEIWSDILSVNGIGRQDDFFDLGGDSLLAITLLARIESTWGTSVSIRSLMENSTLKKLAMYIQSCSEKAETILQTGSKGYRLLPQQKAIYAVCSKNPETLEYNVPTYIPLHVSVDRMKLSKAIKKLPQIHPELGTYIRNIDGQICAEWKTDIQIEIEQWSEEEKDAFVRPFDMENGPLIRAGFTEKGLLFDVHHIIADGISLSLILNDLARIYSEEMVNAPDFTYADYASYFYSKDFSEAKRYFQNVLKCDFEPVLLPETREQKVGGLSKFYYINKKDADVLKKYALSHGLTETMIHLAVFGMILSKYSNNDEILTSVTLTNRKFAAVQNITGMFVNTLPILLMVKGKTKDYYKQVKEKILGLYEYQEFPFSEIAKAIKMNEKNVMNTSFIYQADGVKQLTLGEEQMNPEWLETKTSKFDLSCEVTPVKDGYSVRFEYNSEKYDENIINQLFDGYILIIQQLEKEYVSNISVLKEEKINAIVHKFNDSKILIRKDVCVHELFEEKVRCSSDKTALVFNTKEFSYDQLDKMSNSLAHYLRSIGVGRKDIIPILSRRSWHVIVAMLGVLKAGAAYMPVDPTYPAERIENMFESAQVKVAITYCYRGSLPIKKIELANFDFSYNQSTIKNINTSDDTCYVIFTSGSTGKPKGIQLSHRNVVNYTHNNEKNVCHRIIQAGYGSIVSVTNIVFDIFVTESLLPLLNGITIYFADDETVFSQKKLATLISSNQIDVIQTTPTKMRSYIMDKRNVAYLGKLKAILLGGETFPVDLYDELRRYTEAKIFNIYGPAETTVWSTCIEVNSSDITIGYPIANTQVYIVDSNLNILPVGVAGELCIAGAGVGKGYLNRPDLTAEKFVPNPFASEENGHGKIMYRTGDLARWRANGEIEYLGRIDTQVKIRGLRIELAEIESVMSSFRGINLAAVTDKKDENGRQYLVGYYTADTEVDEREIREYLLSKLPKYMVPNYFVHLKEMPMTASGKTDRKNLPLPLFKASSREYVAPETTKEKELLKILTDLLEIEGIGVEDEFFELGGDSLKAIEFAAEAQRSGIMVSVKDIFDHKTIRAICNTIRKTSKGNLLSEPIVTQIADRTWCIDENGMDLLFLIEGTEKSLLIDTGTGTFDIPKVVSRYTDKPLIVALTHGHADHAGGISWFNKVYLHKDDYYLANSVSEESRKRYIGQMTDISNANDSICLENGPYNPAFLPLEDKDVISLGERDIVVYETPGHTKGSISFLDIKERIIFTGDACSSTTVLDCISDFEEKMSSIRLLLGSAKKLEGLKLYYDKNYNGHYRYVVGEKAVAYLPEDITHNCIELCEELLHGRNAGNKCIEPFIGECFVAEKKNIRIVY